MGLDKFKRTPCGFCFVEYYLKEDAANAIKYVNGTRLDDRIIRTDWDAGFIEGRQFGRGKSGGQVTLDFIIKAISLEDHLYSQIFKKLRFETSTGQISTLDEEDTGK